MWGAQKRSKTRLKNTPCKNAFKKHPLQNRTNVQIKGGGGQRPFEQCSKKLHFFETMASLMKLILCQDYEARFGQDFKFKFGRDADVKLTF